MTADPLLVTAHRGGADARVELDGQLDVHTAPVFVSAVRHLLDVGTTALAVDAGAVAFADSAGLRALVLACSETAQLGGTLEVVEVSEPLDRLLHKEGLHDVLGVARGARPLPAPR